MNINRDLLLNFWGGEAKEGLEQRAVRSLTMGTNSLLVVSVSRIFVFFSVILVAPQLWGNCTTTVRQLHHNCGATSICLVKTKIGDQKNNGRGFVLIAKAME